MTLQGLYEYAEENGIEIYTEMKLHNKKAFAIEEVSGERAVVLDRSKIETRCEERRYYPKNSGTCTATPYAMFAITLTLCALKTFVEPNIKPFRGRI